jgi:inosine-uridine nucleoside N-ribohydrolase
MIEKIIIDCDNTLGILFNEVDDGLAILYLLGTPSVEILGLTTTFGNGRIDQVFPKTQKLVQQLALNIPVIKGESEQRLGEQTPASNFLVGQVDQNPGEITVLATGPVGNLFAAAKKDPDFFNKVRRIVVMGGTLQPIQLGYRNLKELNFSAHPEAAMRVLTASSPLIVFPAQACLEAPYQLKDIYQADYWPGWMKRTLTQWLIAFSLYTGGRVFYLWDLLPAVFLSKPEIFTMQPFKLGSSLADMKQGMLVEAKKESAPEIGLAVGIKDRGAFYAELERGWRRTTEKYPL